MSDLIQSAVGQTELNPEKKRIRLAVALVYFCMGLCFSSWASRIPDIKSALHLNDAMLGSILFALPVGQFLMMPFSGKLVTRFGSRKVLLFALPVYTICLNNIGLVKEGWQLAIALFLFGIAGNLCNISINTQGVAAERLYERPIMASFHGGWSLAGFTGALIGLLMINLKVPPHWHFITVILIVWVIVWVNHPFLVKGKSGANKDEPKRKFFSRPDSILLQLGIIGFCSMASEGAMFDWSGVYFKDVVKVPSSLVILGYTSFMIMMASGRFLADYIISKIGQEKAASDQWCNDLDWSFYFSPVSISDTLHNCFHDGWIGCFQHCTHCLQCSGKTQQGTGRYCPGNSCQCKFPGLFNGASAYRLYL